MYDCALAICVFFSVIHKGGVWLPRQQAEKAMDACNLFCSGYRFLAGEFYKLQQQRYHLEPSLHQFKHVAVRILVQLQAGANWILSPGAFLCDASEDFVGQTARTSRRVAARTCGQRTLQRFLIKVHLHWTESKADSARRGRG